MKYLFVIFLAATLSMSAQNDNWIKLAEKTVAFKSETDKIQLLGNERKIDKIKIKCTQGTLQLVSITIGMENGEEKKYDARGVGILTKGMSSTGFAVPNKDEKVKWIKLEYDSKGMLLVTKKAKVEVLGKKEKE